MSSRSSKPKTSRSTKPPTRKTQTEKSQRSSSQGTKSILSKLKAKQLPSNSQIDVELASEVVKKYILPILESEKRVLADCNRAASQGKPKPTRSNKLSDIFKNQLLSVKAELSKASRLQSKTLNEKEELKLQARSLKDQLLERKTYLNSLRLSCSRFVSSSKRSQFEAAGLTHKVQAERSNYLNISKERLETLVNLNSEKRHSFEIQRNWMETHLMNSSLTMRNKLTGETLRGLYENSSNLKGGLKVLKSQLSKMLEGSVSMTQFENNAHFEFQELQKFKSKTVFQNCETADYRINVQNEVKSIRLQSREKLDHLKKSFQKAAQESLKLSQKCEEVDHKKETAQLRNDQVRNQIQILQDKNKNKEFEKFCLNCGKHYFEEDNFNWSCVRHLYSFENSIYWCCGKTKETAEGCVKSKHSSEKEEEKKQTSQVCGSCKQTGHTSHNCAKDPNRTHPKLPRPVAKTLSKVHRYYKVPSDFAELSRIRRSISQKPGYIQKENRTPLRTPMGSDTLVSSTQSEEFNESITPRLNHSNS